MSGEFRGERERIVGTARIFSRAETVVWIPCCWTSPDEPVRVCLGLPAVCAPPRELVQAYAEAGGLQSVLGVPGLTGVDEAHLF